MDPNQSASTQQQTAPEIQPVQPEPPVPEVPPTPPIAPVETNAFVPESPKKDSPLMKIAIILALVAVLAIAAYVFGMKIFTAQPTPTPTVAVTPSPTPDVTANWETYTNTKYKFELKYPSNLPSFKNKIISTSDKPFYVIRELFSSENFGVEYGIEIAIWDNPSKSTLKTWLESMKDSQALDFPALPIEDSNLTSNYTIDGKEALRFWSDLVSKGQEPGDCEQSCPINEVYVAHNDKVYRILFGFSREVNDEDLKTLNQILSTFKFIEATPSATPVAY